MIYTIPNSIYIQLDARPIEVKEGVEIVEGVGRKVKIFISNSIIHFNAATLI